MTDFDIQRATAIVEKGVAHGLMECKPDSDTDIIVAAEQLVELSRQVERVKDAWMATDAGEAAVKDHVPSWPIAELILIEANVFAGANGSATELPSAPPSSGEERESSEPALSAPTPGAPPILPSAPSRSDGESSGQAGSTESAPLPPAPSTSSQSDPLKDEVWADAQGVEWLLLKDGGGATVEVMKVETGEKTVGPAGMLKRRVRGFAERDDTESGPGLIPDPEPEPQEVPGEPEVVITPDPGPAAVALQEDYESDLRDAQSEATDIARGEPEHQNVLEHDDEGDDKYQELLADTQERYTPSGMPIPRDLENPPEIDPATFDEVPDREARALHSKYNALAARAKYLHDVEDARARGCDMLRKLYLRGAMRKAREHLGSKATEAHVRELAEESDKNVTTWADRAQKHKDEADAFKTFFEIYSQHVVVLSRDWTMREKQINS